MNQRDRIAMQLIGAPPPIEEGPGFADGPNVGNPLSPEDLAAIEQAMNGPSPPPGYAEWDTIPPVNPGLSTYDTGMPPPQGLTGGQAPDWFTQDVRKPITFTRGDEEDT